MKKFTKIIANIINFMQNLTKKQLDSRIIGQTFESRFKVVEFLDRGNFGWVYTVKDLQDESIPLVMKVC